MVAHIHKKRRGNSYIPNNDSGHRVLLALLHCRADRDFVLHNAPWLTATILAGLQRKARTLSFDAIGPLIALTPHERRRYRAWRFLAVGMTWDDVARERRERRAAKERKRRADQRAMHVGRSPRERRDAAILRMLGDGPATMPRLYQRARLSRAFQPVVVADKCFRQINKRRARTVRKDVCRTVSRLIRNGSIKRTVRGTVVQFALKEPTRPPHAKPRKLSTRGVDRVTSETVHSGPR
jgi:hypothetical protein